MTHAIEQREPAKQGRLKPPFVCPWQSSGCTHVTRTSAVAHRRHIARHEKQEMRQRIYGTASTKVHVGGAKKLLARLQATRSSHRS
ncbi:MAG TPA: hypothetical protein VKB26_05590 [Candidatus Acidoferrales bacterium]|nr:hypothetical protein [Candidatus Acidoferrales bacterium]